MISLNYTLMKNGLRELSDVDYQLRVWCGHEKNQQSSLVEAIEKIFDDSGYQ